jgi:hypothetical protein
VVAGAAVAVSPPWQKKVLAIKLQARRIATG